MEVIVAMIIILVVLDISMMIFTNAWRVSLSVKKLRAEGMLRQVLTEQRDIKDLTDQVFIRTDMHIEMKVQRYQEYKKLLQVSLKAYDQNQQEIAQLKEIIIGQ